MNIASFLLSNEDRLRGFLGTTGIIAEDLNDALITSDFQSGILEYLLSREDLLLQFCEENGVDPAYPRNAALILNGVQPDW